MTLNEIFIAAERDVSANYCCGIGYCGYMKMGIKIVRDNLTLDIKIYQTNLGGDNYREANPVLYKRFLNIGWSDAVLITAIEVYQSRLEECQCKYEIAKAIGIKGKRKSERLFEDIEYYKMRLGQLKTLWRRKNKLF